MSHEIATPSTPVTVVASGGTASGAPVTLAHGDTLTTSAGVGLNVSVAKSGTTVTETFSVKTVARYQPEACDQLPMARLDGLIGLPATKGSVG
jgi:hypothetical protein